MGKAGFLLYGASGKLGNVVLSNGSNGTIIREKKTPKNPRSTRQMRQRALFATAVRFFKHANQRFFKFAFEDKKKGESDYNAFMRHNLSKSTIYAYPTMQNESWPAIGNNWNLTQGSLGQLIPEVSGTRLRLACPSITGEEQSFGQVAAAIIADHGVQAGDFLTIVGVRSVAQEIDEDVQINPSWNIKQYVLNPNDLMALGDVINVAADGGYVTFDVDLNPDDACAGAVVISRDIAGGGVKVTTSNLVNNAVAQSIYDASLDEAYRQQALNSWGATGEAILQGSLVENAVPTTAKVHTINDLPLPYEETMEADTNTITFNNVTFLPSYYRPSGVEEFKATNGIVDLAWEGTSLIATRKEGLSGIETITFQGQKIIELDVLEA